MKKIIFLSLLPIFFAFTSPIQASLVKIEKSGEVVVSVLSKEDEALLGEERNLEIKRIASEDRETNSNIVISKSGEKVSMRVGMDEIFEVTDWNDDLVEIEARENVKRVKIAYRDGKFLITEDVVAASTNLPIIVDPESGKFLLETDTGRKYLTVLPADAARSALKTRLMTRLSEKPLEIINEDEGLSYIVEGEKVVSLLDFYDIKLPISTKISASTGEIESILEPEWLRFISFIFV